MRLALPLLLLVAGCAGKTPPPEVRTVTVNVPTRQPCVPASLGGAPDYPDTDSALRKAADAAERYLLLFAGRELRKAREVELVTVIQGCQ